MSKPLLTVCRTCSDEHGLDAWNGEALFRQVKAERKARGLKKVFELEGVRCLKMCDTPCNVVLSGEKRSTLTRSRVNALVEVGQLIDAAVAYGKLPPGAELPERALPGISGD